MSIMMLWRDHYGFSLLVHFITSPVVALRDSLETYQVVLYVYILFLLKRFDEFESKFKEAMSSVKI